jgi:DNA-binding phage protein
MALIRDFRETVKARAESDPAFRLALYQEAVQSVLEGDLATAKLLLRDYINATTGFAALSEAVGIGEKSLMRMLSPQGNPRAKIFSARWRRCGMGIAFRSPCNPNHAIVR